MNRTMLAGLIFIVCSPVFAQEVFVFYSSEQWTVPSGDTSRRTYFQPTDAIYFVDPADLLLKRINFDGSGGVSVLKPGLGPVEFVFAYQDKLYMSTPNAVWKSDGTEPNTVMIREFATATGMALDLLEGRFYARVIGGAEEGMWVMVPISGLSAAGIAVWFITAASIMLVGVVLTRIAKSWPLDVLARKSSTSISQETTC